MSPSIATTSWRSGTAIERSTSRVSKAPTTIAATTTMRETRAAALASPTTRSRAATASRVRSAAIAARSSVGGDAVQARLRQQRVADHPTVVGVFVDRLDGRALRIAQARRGYGPRPAAGDAPARRDAAPSDRAPRRHCVRTRSACRPRDRSSNSASRQRRSARSFASSISAEQVRRLVHAGRIFGELVVEVELVASRNSSSALDSRISRVRIGSCAIIALRHPAWSAEQDDAHDPAEIAELAPLFWIAGNVELALGRAVAGETGLAV